MNEREKVRTKSVHLSLLFSLAYISSAHAEIIYKEFSGSAEWPLVDYVIEMAIADAQNNAAAEGYSNCQLNKTVTYPYNATWYASAFMTCSKDTTPPPPPPKYCPKIVINPVFRDGSNHTVTWDYDPSTVGFTLLQSIDNGEWRQVLKGNTSRSWTMYNAYPANYRYEVVTPRINGEGDGSGVGCYSVVVGITISNPPVSPSIVAPSLVVSPAYRVAWGASQSADQYILEKSAADGSWASVYVGSSTYFDVEDGTPGEYSYRVKACQNSACSEASLIQVFVVRSINSVIENYILSN